MFRALFAYCNLVISRNSFNDLAVRAYLQRVESLTKIILDWTDASDHQSMRIAAKRVLQQPRQFRVSIRYVRRQAGFRWISQSRNHIAERKKTSVNGDALFRSVADGGCSLELSAVMSRYFVCQCRSLTRSLPAKSTQ